MGFFEDAISKTKEVFDVACQKTGEIVTTEKQKISIASLKSKREKDYAALGKLYFEMVKDADNVDDDTRNLVDAIIEKSEEINRLNEEIQNAKNKLICPYCGANIDMKSSFCNICGRKLY